MATVQDYLNMAISLTLSNKSGTDKAFALPDDFRKYSDLKVKQYHVKTGTAAGHASTVVPLNTSTSADGLFFAFFSHPVKVTKLHNTTLGTPIYTSFVGFARNQAGTGNFTNVAVSFVNSLHTPDFDSESGGAMAEVDYIYVDFRLE
jgi:hypothetical protein